MYRVISLITSRHVPVSIIYTYIHNDIRVLCMYACVEWRGGGGRTLPPKHYSFPYKMLARFSVKLVLANVNFTFQSECINQSQRAPSYP